MHLVYSEAEPNRYQAGDEVTTPGETGIRHGEIVSTIPDRVRYENEFGPVTGSGPLYQVNEGNVHSDAYTVVYAESALTPGMGLMTDPDDKCAAPHQTDQRRCSWWSARTADAGARRGVHITTPAERHTGSVRLALDAGS